ncbi:hypothetical protein FSP39_009716 [Pinctada imbricata]|uniref:C-type lectin domain-containing protein n=1 Tax=Pinctada imbricata TaxID=66713 RepID=A0AA89BYE0_PINIB|nr:hypothetical protein FSP39_009716 [Pinctada imbricata]
MGITTERWWTSLSDLNHPGTWTWGQSPAAVTALGNSVVWNVEPDDSAHIENCGAMNIQGTISDEKCGEKHGFICELPTSGDCPDGWMSTDTACYLFSDFSDPYSFKTWNKAKVYCSNVIQQAGPTAHLIYLETAAELAYIRRQLPGVNMTSQIWWIGMNDKLHENAWVWGDGTSVNQSNLEISTFYLGDSPSLTQLGCPPNWLRAGHKCYYFNSNKNYTWQSALNLCRQRQGNLINIQSSDEKHWLEFESRRWLGVPFWSGLNFKQDQNLWYWSTGLSANRTLIHWDSEPNDFAGREDCAFIFQDGTFNDFPCFLPAAVACELDSEDAPCPAGWTPSLDEGSSSCYYIGNTTQADIATWYEARDKCKALSAPLDGYLLAVNSADEMAYVSQLIQQKTPTSLGWWTGLNDMKTEGQWVYDTPFNNPIASNVIKWNSEPNNRGGHDYCAVVYYGGRYNDVDCGDTAGYICQMDAYGSSSSKGISCYQLKYP